MRLALALALLAAGPALAAPYDFTALPSGFTAVGLNNLGQVAVQAPTDQPEPGGPNFGIPSLYDHGTVTPISPLLTSTYLISGLNDTGAVVGVHAYARFDDPIHFVNGAFVGTAAAPPNMARTEPVLTGLNNQGQVVGHTNEVIHTQGDNGYGIENGFISSGDSYALINATNTETVTPLAINNLGQAVGTYSFVGEGHQDGFLYSAGAITTIDRPGAVSTSLNGINDAGEVSGTYTDAAGAQHGFTEAGGVFSDVTGPDGSAFLGSSVNNQGQLIGTFGGTGLSYLATPQAASAPVPEPGTAALLGGTLGAMLLRRTRKQPITETNP